jgi:hypothetical protein
VAKKHWNGICELADDMSPLQTTLEQAIKRIVVEEVARLGSGRAEDLH